MASNNPIPIFNLVFPEEENLKFVVSFKQIFQILIWMYFMF